MFHDFGVTLLVTTKAVEVFGLDGSGFQMQCS